MLKAIAFGILRRMLLVSRLDKAISYVVATNRLLDKYKLHLLSTHYVPAKRSAIDNLFYGNVLKHWLETEYYADKDPVAREGEKALVIAPGSSDWASTYDEKPFDLQEPLARGHTLGEGVPLYLKLRSCIENYGEKKNCRIVQIGVASGRELAWFAGQFPEIECIGTDAFSGAVEHARRRYQLPNLEYCVLSLERASNLLENYRNNHIFFYTSGLFHFVQPEFVDDFLKYISSFQNLDLFISEPVTLPEMEKTSFPKHSVPRIKPMSWTHNYPDLVEKNGLTIREFILTDNTSEHQPVKFASVNCFIWAKPSSQEVKNQLRG